MVVVSGSWVKNVVAYPINGELIGTVKMAAKALLICRPNSHPFQERQLSLDQPVKIGRSVARARAVPNNAIFDCKVLSRNHALLWYENGKFYLQDTKSSNGTFVNNQRLSKGAEESPPREVCSGDIVQFGVDVMENARKVTHGCIVATVKLFLPDGKEAKASPSTSVVTSVGMVPLENLYTLQLYLKEAHHMENQIETKLSSLQKIVASTMLASQESWKKSINEERLVSRIATLEAQLKATSKNAGEDKLQEEVLQLHEDKHLYQVAAKEALQKVIDEKYELSAKLLTVELSLHNSESERAHLKQLGDQGQQDLLEITAKFSEQLLKVEELTAKLNDFEELNREHTEKLALEKQELQHVLEVQTEQNQELLLQLDAINTDGNLNTNRMTDLQSDLQQLKENEEKKSKQSIDSVSDLPSEVILECIPPAILDNAMEEVEDLRFKLQNCQDNLQANKDLVYELQGSAESMNAELTGAEEDLKMAKVNLETVRSEEDLTLVKSINLQERIDGIGQELYLASERIDTNKRSEIYPENCEEMLALKAERANLQELLAEVRTKKIVIEEQKEVFEQDLNSANVKVKMLTEESNILKQQLLSAQSHVHDNVQIALDLQTKIDQLEASLGEYTTGIETLQLKLTEESNRSTHLETFGDSLKEKCMESQQTCKKYRNQCEQLQDRCKALQAAHIEAEKNSDTKKKQEVSMLTEKICSLEREVCSLKEECIQHTAVVREVDEARLREQELLQRLDFEGVPRDPCLDDLEEELIEIKTNFMNLSAALEKVNLEFDGYRQSHPTQLGIKEKHLYYIVGFCILAVAFMYSLIWY